MKNTHFVYGFVTALVMIIIGVILYITNLSFTTSWAPYISFIPFLVGIIMNANAFSKANEENVTFGTLFSSCYKACAIITLVGLAWAFISLALFPDMIDKALEMSSKNMAEKKLSQEQIDQAIEMTRKNFKLFMIIGVIFGYMFFGAIFSLIGAAVAKKKPAVSMPY